MADSNVTPLQEKDQESVGDTSSSSDTSDVESACCPFKRRRLYIVIGVLAAVVVAIGIAVGVAAAVLKDSARPNIIPVPEKLATESNVFITPRHLTAMMAEPQSVTLLDARPSNPTAAVFDSAWTKIIPGSKSAKWGQFTESGGHGGLLSAAEQASIFEGMGVSSDVPVVVYGGWSSKYAWGEEGRIFWQLDYLGHKNVSILYGGIYGWLEGDYRGKANPQPGMFTTAVNEEKRVISSDILSELTLGVANGSVVLVDNREESEYEGDTPYGSPRGGHIPGAKSYHWRNAFDDNGALKSPEALLKELEQIGITDGIVVIPYCTGGIRSAFFFSVLRWLGISSVSNYDGSWWDWSGNPNLPVIDGSITGGSALG
mmetsp:Transcript_15777/g.44153  ORF Transcript_15777/g.44153 Transcript_15777/m.44153 type:complete len:372 (-) Transcript_15777:471-1586(-)